MLTFDEAVMRIRRAASFGEIAGDGDADRAYREWAKLVHRVAVGRGGGEPARRA